MPSYQDIRSSPPVDAAYSKGLASGEKVQPWKKFRPVPKTEYKQPAEGIFEYPDSLIRLRCEADDKSLGG